MIEGSEAQPQQSTFVSVVAWLILAVYVFKAATGALQVVIFWTVYVMADFQLQLEEMRQDSEVPFWISAVFANMHWFATVSIVIAVGMIVVCIGLLLRKEWARRIFVVFLSLKVVLGLVGLVVFPLMVFSQGPWREFLDSSDPATGAVKAIFVAFMVVITGFTLIFNALYAWVAWKFTRPEVRQEFQAPSSAIEPVGV